MNGEEKIRTGIVCNGSSLFEREELITRPSQHDMHAALAKARRKKLCHIEDEIFLT